MKTVDEHFKKILRELQLEKLVSPKTSDKISELERACTRGVRLSDELKQIFEIGRSAVEKFRYLNSIVAGENLGDILIDESFTALRKHQLNIKDLASIVDYVTARIQAHTHGVSYDYQFLLQDKELVKLPQQVAQLVNNTPGHAGNFLKYLKHIALEASPDKLNDFYAEFNELVQEGIIAAGTFYSGVLEVRRLGKSWEDLRFEKSGDEKALKWINKFEELEKKYPSRNLPEIARLYKKEDDSNL